MSAHSLKRFHDAQKDKYAGYEVSLQEMRSGCKVSHWIWYIFPQLKGLGMSDMADYYGIDGLQEAQEYMADTVLRKRLIEISTVLLNIEGKSAAEILGYIDAIKVRSSMTLFAEAVPEEPIFTEVLKKYYHGEKDEKTLGLLKEISG